MSNIRKIVADVNFRDKDTKVLIESGTVVAADEDRLYLLDKQGVTYQFVDEDEDDKDNNQEDNEVDAEDNRENEKPSFKHTGGTWYEFADGEKVQGKENAEKRLKEKLGEE